MDSNEAPVWRHLAARRAQHGAAYITLLDPDKHDQDTLCRLARVAGEEGADAVLFGTSLSLGTEFARRASAVRAAAQVPVILFPAHAAQIVPGVDAVLFLTLLSGRNPQYLVAEQVRMAPLVKEYGLEPIPVGYLLVESGRPTTVEFVSDTRPLPRDKPDIAVGHALAAECMGMKVVYLEGGSGAAQPVPEEMIRQVARATALPVMVGGGIRTPEQAARAVAAGAAFVVTGDAVERTVSGGRDGAGAALERARHAVRAFAEAVHGAAVAGRRPDA